MFARRCTACETRFLVFSSDITGMVKLDEGFAVSYTCQCGADQVWLTAGEESAATGRRVPSAA